MIIGLLFSCTKKANKEPEVSKQQESKPALVVGGDKDLHGCKASAGYTWSVLKKKCVRIFEVGKKLTAVKDGENYTTAAYVIFNGDKAELFLDNQEESIILQRKSEGEPWVKDDFRLIPWKGYVLKKGKDIIYTGR